MIIDTSAWVELFLGGRKGEKVARILRQNPCYSSVITLAEISNWASREGRSAHTFIDVIKASSVIIPLSEEIATLAGALNYERKKRSRKWGMMDSIIMATAEAYSLRILSADTDFIDLPSAVML